jgi:SAM-dependent methyltransferase
MQIKNLTKAKPFHNKSLADGADRRNRLVRQFNEKSRSGEVEFEEVRCLCGSEDFERVASVDRYGFEQPTVICRDCGLIQSNPRMTPPEYAAFYSSDFYRDVYLEEGSDRFSEKEFEPRALIGSQRFEFITSHVDLNSIQNVLEVGCAAGWNLYPFHQHGLQVVGYDYGPKLVGWGRQKGMDLRVGTPDPDTLDDRFDLIILSHVLEHFTDPVTELRKVSALLKETGILYIEVPDIKYALSLRQFQNAHCYYFTDKTLRFYSGSAGLSPIIQVHGIVGNHLSCLFKRASNPEPCSLKGEYRDMKKRFRSFDRRIRLRHLVQWIEHRESFQP